MMLLLALPLASQAQTPADTTHPGGLPTVDGSNGRCLPSSIVGAYPVSEWDGSPVIGLFDAQL